MAWRYGIVKSTVASDNTIYTSHVRSAGCRGSLFGPERRAGGEEIRQWRR